jgi:hypothetical protein
MITYILHKYQKLIKQKKKKSPKPKPNKLLIVDIFVNLHSEFDAKSSNFQSKKKCMES